MKHLNFKLLVIVVVTLTSMLGGLSTASAQISFLGAQYYHNLFLSNPAFAGYNDGLSINLNYRNQWTTIPGSPVVQSVTGDYRFDNRAGAGLYVYNDKDGLFSRTRVTGSYAYHLPLAEDQEMHFGLSLGFTNDRFNEGDMVARPEDQAPGRYNMRKTYLDGDFGMAYTNTRLTLQGSMPNLKAFLKKDTSSSVGRSTAFLAASYKIGRDLDVFSIEPKLAYRASKGTNGVVDVGANLLVLNNQLSFTGIYSSGNTSTFGVGLSLDKYMIQGFYTNQTAAERVSTGGSFEINLKMRFLQKESIYNRGY